MNCLCGSAAAFVFPWYYCITVGVVMHDVNEKNTYIYIFAKLYYFETIIIIYII